MASLGRPGPGPRAALPAWKREILERKRAKLAALGGGAVPAEAAAGPAAERLVVAESLGPLRDNPFMRLESERRRGAGAAGARPVQQLLELYRRVPGVRTIRADNILIIETAPGFAPAAEPGPAAHIRASEVLVYEAPPPPGRVSRLLQKFDAPRRLGSPERLPPPSPSPSAAERAARPEPERRGPPSPGPGPDLGARRSDFLLKTSSNSFTVHPRGLHRGAGVPPLPNGPAVPEPKASAANGLEGSAPKPAVWKPKVGSGSPPLHRTPSAIPASPPDFLAPGPASATPSQRQRVSGATSANDSFEIRPASKPDLSTIPEGDLQARALASLRANSRNSFVLVPKRKAPGALSSPGSRAPGGPATAGAGWGSRGLERRGPLEIGGDKGARGPQGPEELGRPRPATALVDPGVLPLPSPSPSLGATAEAQGFGVPEWPENGREPGLPVTFIDEVDSEDEAPGNAKLPSPGTAAPPQYRPHPSGAGPRGGSTFLVVPKRKPGSVQAGGEPSAAEEGEESSPGAALKLRYPTVHEIEVVGGYLSLQRSCLVKAGSSRKKMKISFNDASLQTTFEYPSESSLAQEAAEEEEEEEEEEPSLDGAVEKPFKFFLPRATFVGNRAPESPLLPDGGSCLSSYTPKHSVAFSKWQEQPLEPAPRQVETPLKEVMLTPAGQNDLSDFRSEPALYF